jgi:hypothetical protein
MPIKIAILGETVDRTIACMKLGGYYLLGLRTELLAADGCLR